MMLRLANRVVLGVGLLGIVLLASARAAEGQVFAEGFEKSPAGWQGIGFEVAAEAARSGEAGLCVRDGSRERYEQAQSAPIPLEAGKEYLISVWCRPVHTTSTIRFTAIQTRGTKLFKPAAGGILFVGHHFDAQSQEWQRGIAAFRVAEGADGVRLDLEAAAFGKQNTGEAFFDDITIREVVLPKVPLTDSLLEADSDADTIPDGWCSTLDSITMESGEKRRGATSVLVAHDGGKAGLTLSVEVEPFVRYELSLWVKVEGEWPEWPAQAKLVFTPQGSSAQEYAMPVCAAREWQRLVLRAWSPPGAHSARVVAIQVEGRTRLRIDDLSLRPVARRPRHVSAAHLAAPITIDGDLSDWPALPAVCELQIGGVPVNEYPNITDWISFIAPRPPTADISGLAYMAWGAEGLNIAVRVSDDELAWGEVGESDGVRIGLTRERKHKLRRWYRPCIELPLPTGAKGEVRPYRLASEVADRIRPIPEVKAAAQPCDGGYVMEVFIPFHLALGGGKAAPGVQVGLEVLLLDRDPGRPAKSERPHAVNWRAATLAPDGVYEAINQWHPEDCGVLTLADSGEGTVQPGQSVPAATVKPLPARVLKPIVRNMVLVRGGKTQAALVVPDSKAYQELGNRLQAAIRERSGVDVPFVDGASVSAETFREHDLIVLGNITNNPAVLLLHANYLVSADAATLAGEYVIHTAATPFGGEHSAIVIAADSSGTAQAAVTAFVDLLPAGPDIELPLLHVGPGGTTQSAASSEALEQAGEGGAKEIAGMVSTRGGRGVTTAVGKHGFRFHQSGDPVSVARLGGAARRYFEYLAKEGHAHGDTDDFIDSTAWWMLVGLDNVEDAGVLSEDERRFVTNLVYSISHYCGSMCTNWPGSPVPVIHNHMSFPLLSSWVSSRYFAEHYDDSAAREWMWVTDVVFGRQALSAQPQEDAGGYLRLVPEHVMHWALASGERAVFETGNALEFAKLCLTVTDNLGCEAQFGDGGGPRTPMQANLLRTVALATDNPALAWLPDKHERVGGRYACTFADAGPPDICGVRNVGLTPAFYDYARAFTGVTRELSDIPVANTYHKLSLRGGLEVEDEYLLLDGLGRGYHHHEDANSIIRMTDKGMICLLDAHYTNRGPIYHNSITVVRDGKGAVFPLFAQKLVAADLPRTGFVQSLLDDYNGVGWYRNILWVKGEYFLVVDELRAKEAAEYSFQCLWRTLGQAVLRGPRMLNRSREGAVFHVLNADSADRLRLSHDVFGIDVERGRGEVTKLHQIASVRLTPGESHTFLNLLYTDAPGQIIPTEIRKAASQAVLIRRSGAVVLAGLAGGGYSIGDVSVQAEMFWLGPERVALAGATSLDWRKPIFAASAPVNIEIDLATREGTIEAITQTQVTTGRVATLDGREVGTTFAVSAGRHSIRLGRISGSRSSRRRHLAKLWKRAGDEDSVAHMTYASTPQLTEIWRFAASSFDPKGVLSRSAATQLSSDLAPCTSSPWVATHPVRLSHLTDETKDFTIWPRDASPTLTFAFGHDVQVDEITIKGYWSHVPDQDLPVQPLRFTAMTADGRVVGQAVQEKVMDGKSDLVYLIRTKGLETAKLMIRCEPRTGAALMIREITVLGIDPKGVAPASEASGGVQIAGLDARDTNGDGAAEVLLGTQKGRLVLLDSEGSPILDKTLTAPINDVALADLEGDGPFELLTGSEDATARCFDPAGNEKWATSFRFYFRPGHVTVLRPADLDGDGAKEVVVGTFNSMTHALSVTGQVLWDAQVYHHWTKSLEVADIDGDGSKECIFGTSYSCVDIKRADGTGFWRRSAGGKFYGDVTCADLDGDGTLDTLAGSKNQCVIRWDDTGKRRFKHDTGATVNAVTTADLDGDGKPEILAGSSSFCVYALKADGELLWTRNLGDEILQLEIGELNGQAGPVIVAGCADGRVVVLDSTGTTLGHFQTGGPVNQLRLADLNRDGYPEAIAASWDGTLYALALPVNSDRNSLGRKQWGSAP